MSVTDLLAAATRRPWSMYDRGSQIELDNGAYHVAQIDTSYDSHFDRAQCAADAALIVRAVNEYEALCEIEAIMRRHLCNPQLPGCIRCAALAKLDEIRGAA